MAAQALLSPPDGTPSHVYKGKVTPIPAEHEDEPSSASNPISGDTEGTGLEQKREHMYVLAAMVSNLQEKFCISPLSKPLDGQMRLLHFGPMEGEKVMRVMGECGPFFAAPPPLGLFFGICYLSCRQNLLPPQNPKETTKTNTPPPPPTELASTTQTHTSEPGITYLPISGLRIDFEEPDARWRRVCVDGKIVVVSQGGWVTVLREEGGRLELIV